LKGTDLAVSHNAQRSEDGNTSVCSSRMNCLQSQLGLMSTLSNELESCSIAWPTAAKHLFPG